MLSMKVNVVVHDPAWPDMYAAEAERIKDALGSNVTAIHHIGSTAIAGIHAKPIIDLLIGVADLTDVDARAGAMAILDYEAMGAYGIEGRRYFRKADSTGTRTHHAHVFQAGSPHIDRHLAFRDYLRNHPSEARRYSDLKRVLASRHAQDIEAYMDGKDGLIKEIERAALAWWQGYD